MALMKQVVSLANATVTDIEMTPEEESAFLAQQAADQITAAERAALAQKAVDAEVLREKILEALVVGDPVDPKDITDYETLKAGL